MPSGILLMLGTTMNVASRFASGKLLRKAVPHLGGVRGSFLPSVHMLCVWDRYALKPVVRHRHHDRRR